MNRVAKKRIIIVLAVAATLATGAGGLYGWRKTRIANHFQSLRTQGMEAAKSNDYATAVRDLQPYLARYNNDVEALAEYCRVRPQVPSADRSHLRETMTALRYYISLKPDAVEQRRELLRLYLTYNLNTEALDTAERLLATDANNVELLSAKTQALVRLRRNDEALVTARRWTELAPTDREGQITRLELMKLKGTDDATLVKDIEALLAAHPDDQGLQIVHGQVLLLVNRPEEARAVLKAAAAKPSTSPESVRALANAMDRAGLFDDSVRLLATLSFEGSKNDDVSRQNFVTLARRTWERGDNQAFLDLAARRPDVVEDTPDLLAIRGMLLRGGGKTAEGDAAIALLQAKSADPIAKAWSSVIKGSAATATVEEAKSQIALINDALVDRPNDAYLLFFLGEAYSQTGDPELAISLWQRAARSAPAWAIPLVRASNLLAAQGKYDEAFNLAAAAAGRSQRLALQNYIQTWTAAVESGQRSDGAELLTIIDQVLPQIPDQGWIRVARATVLCRIGRANEAKAAIEADLADQKSPLDQSSLLRLAALSRVHKLGLDETLEKRLHADFGQAAETALTQFFRVYLSSGKEAALQAFVASRDAVSGEQRGSRDWLLAEARVRELADDAGATAAWKAVLEKFGDDVSVIQAALGSSSLWRDRTAIDGLIEKLRAASGERGFVWRLHRARWLIEGSTDQAPDLAAAQRASDLLTGVLNATPENVTARYWQARCQVRLGNRGSAIENLMVATRLAPRAGPIALYAAQLLQEQGDFVRAREQLDRLTAQDVTDPQQNAMAARLLAQQGESGQAIGLLEQNRSLGTNEQSDLLLALLYQRQGEYEKAEAIIGKLLREPTLASITFAADFYRSRGKMDVAGQMLEKLYAIQLAPGVREMTLADFQLRRGDTTQARKFAEAATVAAPQNVATWRALVLADVQAGDTAAATATLAKAAQAVPADAYIADLRAESTWPLIAQVRDEVFRPLAVRLAADPKNDPVRQALQLLQKSGAKLDDPLVEGMRQLADRFPLSSPLQVAAAQLLLSSGKPVEAAAIATRGVQSFPTDSILPRLAAQALLTAEQWSQAKAFALVWRRQAGADVLPPDLLAAIASLQLGNSSEAESLLRPHVPYAMDRLEEHSDAIRTFAVALYGTGKASEAQQLIRQALTRRPEFIDEWLNVVGTSVPTGDAIAWMTELEPKLTTTRARTFAARIWLQLSLRADAPPVAATTLRSRLDELQAASDLDAGSLVTLGIIADQTDDDVRAEQLYRRAIEKDVQEPVVWNNLAMLLLSQNRQLEEAETLASRAATAVPAMAGFKDTLAQVQLAAKKYGPARDTINQALKLEPQNGLWRITAAEVAAADGKVDEARTLLNEAMTVPSMRQSLGKDELRRAESLRVRVGGGSPATGAAN